MTDKASPDDPPEGPKAAADLTGFLRDWTALWGDELRAQSGDPEGMRTLLAGLSKGPLSPDIAVDAWRSAITSWAGAMGVPPSAWVRSGERSATPRAAAPAAAPDARDAEIERLARRVDELEARLAKLETGRRPRARS